MADRRMEKALGNDAEKEDKKLEEKFIPDDDKEKVNEHKNSKVIQRRGAYWGI